MQLWLEPLLQLLLALQLMLTLVLLVPVALSVMEPPEVFFMQTVAPLRLTLPTLALAARPAPSDVVEPEDVAQLGVLVPLVKPVTPHPPPVHFWMCPFVSTISAFEAKLVDGVHGPIVGAALVMLKLMTQPPAVVALAPQEFAGTAAKSQSMLVLVL